MSDDDLNDEFTSANADFEPDISDEDSSPEETKTSSRLEAFLSRRYTLSSVKYRAIDRAARYALSTVFLPASAAAASESEGGQIKQAYLGLGDLWRRRLLSLRKSQWSALRGKKFSYARRCPEVGVSLKGSVGRPCGLRRVCPWCWCRAYVQDLFYRVWVEIYGPSWHLRSEPLAVDVLDRTLDEHWREDSTSLRDVFARAAEIRNYAAQNEFPRYYGSFQMSTIEPPDPRQPVPCWHIQHRTLVLSGFAVPPLSEDGVPTRKKGLFSQRCRVRVTTASGVGGLSQRQLTAPIGRVCLYPAQMLRGPADATVQLLEFFNRGPRLRLSEYYRGLRNASRIAREAKLNTLEPL